MGINYRFWLFIFFFFFGISTLKAIDLACLFCGLFGLGWTCVLYQWGSRYIDFLVSVTITFLLAFSFFFCCIFGLIQFFERDEKMRGNGFVLFLFFFSFLVSLFAVLNWFKHSRYFNGFTDPKSVIYSDCIAIGIGERDAGLFVSNSSGPLLLEALRRQHDQSATRLSEAFGAGSDREVIARERRTWDETLSIVVTELKTPRSVSHEVQPRPFVPTNVEDRSRGIRDDEYPTMHSRHLYDTSTFSRALAAGTSVPSGFTGTSTATIDVD